MFTEFEQEWTQKLGNQFQIFGCTAWAVLKSLDVKAITKSLPLNV
jgi:hypothetical protein